MPRNASINAGGFRIYVWEDKETGELTDVLSVTSIRKLAGMPHGLVEWQLKNVVNLAMGVRQITRIGPRGGVKKAYVADGEAPGAFAAKLIEADGDETKLARVRKWLRDEADEPRDVAAVRGSVVHKMIEENVELAHADDAAIHKAFERQWADEKNKIKRTITEQDYAFVRHCLRNYWDMRANVPFVILAQEPQVWNLTAGYAGSADVLIWFLPEGTPIELVSVWQERADKGTITIEEIEKVGGVLCLGDWKTSPAVYTDHVVQGTAYLAAEFVGRDGVKDERLTAILKATLQLALINIRPDKWHIHYAKFQAPVLRAFLGSVAFARFLAIHDKPDKLFTDEQSGAADTEGIDE